MAKPAMKPPKKGKNDADADDKGKKMPKFPGFPTAKPSKGKGY